MPPNDRKESKLSPLEKAAIAVILFLILVILLLIFSRQLIEAFEAFKVWYGNV